ncbi:hypothetical protein GCM10010399_83580 [Dactylosporangium fulvum]|uniref:Uncharacterized protein n=1 Tax=Dactylosporangium fulvum TaxID=53359 RepID=A0ABY5VPR9_9ACTN|nr:hypothetical protein [Dactylosporangium fulvum]UWP79099.1 hypothetical protein Dfulv_28470 [Dactylosporangium fulvum]
MYTVRAGSVLADTAAEVLSRHQPGPDGICPACGRVAPCPTGTYASTVTAAVEPLPKDPNLDGWPASAA